MSEILETSWRLIVDEALPAAENMGRDEALLNSHARGESPPILRLYRWDPGAISIGYFQSFGREVDEEACRARGFEWVRRMTGGRAVLHHLELTYGVVISEDLLPGSVMETYRVISEGLVAGLRNLGMPAELSESPPPTRQSLSRVSAACFDSTTPSEVTSEGRKIVGSAQGRARGVILQHGSVPIHLNREDVVDCLSLGERREAILRILRAKAGSLSEALDRDVHFDEVAAALRGGFEDALGIGFTETGYSRGESEDAERLNGEKYSTEDWNRAIR
ncbi:MAG: lipoate--protein ligase family protein [Bacillota bacterium]